MVQSWRLWPYPGCVVWGIVSCVESKTCLWEDYLMDLMLRLVVFNWGWKNTRALEIEKRSNSEVRKSPAKETKSNSITPLASRIRTTLRQILGLLISLVSASVEGPCFLASMALRGLLVGRGVVPGNPGFPGDTGPSIFKIGNFWFLNSKEECFSSCNWTAVCTNSGLFCTVCVPFFPFMQSFSAFAAEICLVQKTCQRVVSEGRWSCVFCLYIWTFE